MNSNVLTTKVVITVLVMLATDSWMTTRAVKVNSQEYYKNKNNVADHEIKLLCNFSVLAWVV